ncbi:hypothetical protein R3P38DRAFT_2785004 [Favolaschia claudopus]|uniref:Uncharacterized protein n=1 Tax=Favolaschia claudopus TaxID=2862362 RepID=A0AAW0AUY7_9AGAR
MRIQHTAEDSRYSDRLPNKVITEFGSSPWTRLDASNTFQNYTPTSSYPPKSTPTRVRVEDNAPDASATRRIDCTGAYVCECGDHRLLEVKRRDLETGSGDRDFSAQHQTRRDEGTIAEQRAVEAQKQTSNGHNHFVGCSGWTKDFTNHRSSVLAPDLDENLIITAFHGLYTTVASFCIYHWVHRTPMISSSRQHLAGMLERRKLPEVLHLFWHMCRRCAVCAASVQSRPGVPVVYYFPVYAWFYMIVFKQGDALVLR